MSWEVLAGVTNMAEGGVSGVRRVELGGEVHYLQRERRGSSRPELQNNSVEPRQGHSSPSPP